MQTITGDLNTVEIPVPAGPAGLDDGDVLVIEEIRDVAYTRC